MFGLRKLWRIITGSPEVQKLEEEIKDFFHGSADYLIHKHGAEATHVGISVAVKTIQALSNLALSSEEKHAEVSKAIHEAVQEAGTIFSTNDINLTIEAGLSNIRSQALAIHPPEDPPKQ